MQVKETVADGLKHEFQVSIAATEIDAKVDERLADLKDKVRINGFRPGKVPLAHLKKVYGRSVAAETVEQLIRDNNAKIFTERGLRLATEPKVTMPTETQEIEDILAGKADLAYTVAIEVVPAIQLADFKSFNVEKPVAEVTEADIDEAIKRIADQNRAFEAKGEGAKAASGDRVTVSFKGTIDGVAFEGGTAEEVPVVIGSGTFIPGFEDQLIGIAAGETRTVNVTFPESYPAEKLAGKKAEFEVVAKSMEAPTEVAIGDEFAKTLGLESLAKLKDIVKDRIAREHAGMTRQRLKRQLLDELDKLHKFAPPPSLAEDEFNNVWRTIDEDLKGRNRTFEDEGTTEEKAREEYRAIAERRVRLGLVIAEIGDRNKIQVTEEELTRAVTERARQVPGREQEVWDYFRKNPSAVASLRAPIFEDKVIDYILELATITDKTVSREDLYKDDEG